MNEIVEKEAIGKAGVETKCVHCGESCEDQLVMHQDLAFCCLGCKTVYQILNEHELETYYCLNDTPGTSLKHKKETSYTYLDDESTIRRLIDFQDEYKIIVRFYLPQIHCSSCLWLLENLYRFNEHILGSRVDFLKKEVRIEFARNEISLRQVVEILDMIGYAPEIQLEHLDAPKVSIDRSLFYKLGVSGFVFGNIMLLSFPEYLGLDPETDRGISNFLGALNIILILPVLIYSARDYFVSAYQGLKQNHLNINVPIVLGIVALFGRSLFEIISQTGAGYLDSLAGLIFFLLVGKWFQQKTYAKISFDKDYRAYFPISCSRIRQGYQEQITLDQVEIGDQLLVRHGELIPADGVLMKGEGAIDYSFVSGESRLIDKQNGELLYAGGRQMGGVIEISVTKTISDAYLIQLWNDHTFAKEQQKAHVSVIADKVAKIFTWAILSIAFLTLAYWMYSDPAIAINAFTSVLIIACPCAVALSIPFTFGNVVRILSRYGIYLKDTHVVERLARIQYIVFDKTGTITNTSSSRLEYSGADLNHYEQVLIKSLVEQSNHPISRLISAYYQDIKPVKVLEFDEKLNQGIEGIVDGHRVRVGSSEFIDLKHKTSLKHNAYISIDGEYKGAYTRENQLRPKFQEVIANLSRWAKLYLLSGDNDREQTVLKSFFGSTNQMFFNKKPEDKLQFIKAFQEDQKQVCMIGDGLNDAGALQQSDVGITISENTGHFTPACDIILNAAHFRKLPELFQFSRKSIRLVYAAYAIALIYNIVGLSFAVQGLLSPVIAAILMPISSVSIVLFGVGSSYLTARKLGFVFNDLNHDKI